MTGIMIWLIILYIVAGLLFLLLLLLFAPFYLEAKLNWKGNFGNARVSFWWIHPFLVSIRYDSDKNDITAMIARWKIQKKEKEEPTETPQSTESPFFDQTEKDYSQEESIPEKPEISSEKPEIQSKTTESVEKNAGKMDNFIGKLKKGKFLFYLKQSVWIKKIIKWLSRVIRSFGYMINFNYLTAYIRAGIEDPVILGKIYGYYNAISNGLDIKNSRCRLLFEPVFMENYFEGNGEIKLRSSVRNLLLPIGTAIFTFPYLSTLILWWRIKHINKNKGNEKK